MKRGHAGLVASCIWLSALPLVAQTSARDSLSVLHSARANVRAFESRWRSEIEANLPRPLFPVFAVCEQRVGAGFCYGPNNGKVTYSTWSGAVPNVDRFAPDLLPAFGGGHARSLIRDLLASLQDARKQLPGDRWITGQIVRVQLERGAPKEALDVATSCEAERWWCAALRGHVLHLMGLEELADAQWTNALYTMPMSLRCSLLDPTHVVRSDSLRRELREMRCARLIDFAETLWWLADPLHGVAGNERRSEHLSRQIALLLDANSPERLDSAYSGLRSRVLNQLRIDVAEEQGESTVDMFRRSSVDSAHPADMRVAPAGYDELVSRLGVPGYFHHTRTEPNRGSRLVALYPYPRYSFVPSARALTEPRAALESDWQLNAPQHFEFYAYPRRNFVDLPVQAATFRRGAVGTVVIAADIATVPQLSEVGARAILVTRSGYTEPATVTEYRVGDFLSTALSLPAGGTVLSLEVLSRDSSWVGRARFGARPPALVGSRGLSDMLLMEKRGELPVNLEDAVPAALGSARIRAGSVVGLFWEMYGMAAGDSATVSVVAVPHGGSVLTRLGRILPFGNSSTGVSTSWTEAGFSGGSVSPRAIDLDLSGLLPGNYALSLAVEVAGVPLLETVRQIQIVGR